MFLQAARPMDWEDGPIQPGPATRYRFRSQTQVLSIVKKSHRNEFARIVFRRRVRTRLTVSPCLRSVIALLIGVVGEQDGWDRYDQDLRIQGHRPVASIKGIARDALVVRRGASTADLPEPSDTWPTRKVSAD
jgi:hypothetical protein